MQKGLERLFWIIGWVLIIPFAIQQGLVLSTSTSDSNEAPQLRSIPMARPAIAAGVAPVENSSRSQGETAEPKRGPATVGPHLKEPDTSLWSASRIAAWGERIDLVERPAGTLFIPSLDVEMPIFTEMNEAALTLGAGLIPGTGDLDAGANVGLASHRDGHFRHLKQVAEGDVLLLRTNNKLRQFRVVNTQIVEPSDTWVLDPGDTPSITLVTCYPFYFVGSAPQRYIVSAQEVQTELTSVRLSNSVIGGHHESIEF